eukprot:TRINITY_DN19220_c0_g1_i1.p1 TRINITY_DN19220_c0_g1~~TRINITY_DN19220_c0_g1_i1.p1  ORF type:complete len:167 (+),score=32.56 TRINITY_DN19220_c0_g1_i1:546-1046(+)
MSTLLYHPYQLQSRSYKKNSHAQCSKRTTSSNTKDVAREETTRLKDIKTTTGGTLITHTQLLDLMSRDLTPEDYELLLLLDDTVKKKTLASKTNNISNRARLVSVQEAEKLAEEEALCTICLCNYEPSQYLVPLPCGHNFHKDCIVTWLSSSSVNCPVDGLPVEAV